jgi:outer membrane protein assembly factor BamB
MVRAFQGILGRWAKPTLGPEVKEQAIMRYLSQRTPTVDGDRVYAFTARGELICLATADGKEKWRKDYVKDFAGKPGTWGYCDFPLVDGDRLICTPGVKDSALVALDKKSGEVVWKCSIPNSSRGTYGGAVVAEIGGVRQYVHQLEHGVVGVSAKDGKLLWEFSKFGNSMGNVHTVIVDGDTVFASCGWGVGAAQLRLKKSGAEFEVEKEYSAKVAFESWLGSSVRIGDFVHAANGLCIEWKTGKVVEQPTRVVPTNRLTMTAADGRLIHRNGNGVVSLVEVSKEGIYTKRGEFTVAPIAKEPTWTFPVVANGHLYMRDQDVLYRYDLRAPATKPKAQEPDVIFVPTPQDVVEKMLDLAHVDKKDVVADLGCGDGRIVVTAAKKFGCQAFGYDLDPECIRLAKAAVAEAGVEKQVRIEERDIFEVDLSGMTVVTLYLSEKLNARLIPQLNKMKAGSRVVTHVFPIAGVKPDRVMKVTAAEDDVERPLYLYSVPIAAK